LRQAAAASLQTDCPVEAIRCTSTGVSALAAGKTWNADYAILALPLPQLNRVKISGVDDSRLRGSLASHRGAAVRKVIVVYDKAFGKDVPREGAISTPSGIWMLDNSDMEKELFSLVLFLGGPAAREPIGKAEMLSRIATVAGPEALNPVAYRDHGWL